MRNGTAIIDGELQKFQVGKNFAACGKFPSIVLENPKYGRNVSQVVRLASGYGISQVWYTGNRVSIEDPSKNIDGMGGKRTKKGQGKARLPREERMKGYKKVEIRSYDQPMSCFPRGAVPVAIEIRKGATMLQHFEHPENAVYIFGPEDGSVSKNLVSHCHHFIVIPVQHCLNLSTAVSTVLWDRKCKRIQAGLEADESMDDLLRGDRASLSMQDYEQEVIIG